jgi:hypothetical protein
MSRVGILLTVLSLLAVAPAGAMASFRGRDGLLAVQPAAGRGILLVNLKGAVVRRVCDRRSPCASPGPVTARWSPDGRSLALSPAGGDVPAPGVTVVYPDGSCLDCDPIAGAAGAFTADRSVITVVAGGSLRAYGIDGVWKRDVGRGGVVDAVWSSRGQVAVVRASVVWAGRPGGLRRLGVGSTPSWSPDGSRLALVRHGWIAVVRLKHHAVRRLARGSSPAWSPDGRSIAFLGPKKRLFLIAVEGGSPHSVGHLRGRSIDWQPVPSHGTGGCVTAARSRVIARSPDAIVTQDGTSVPFHVGSPAAFTGCLLADGRARVLARYDFQSEDQETGATAAATAGNYAALATFETDFHYGGSRDTLAVYDLRTGEPMTRLGGEAIQCDGYSCETGMDELAINGEGFTAVHAVATAGCTCETIEVSDSTGPRTVDTASSSSGKAVLTDVALSGDTVTWKHDGIPLSTQLH